jgi:hypothetical protein
MVDKKIDKARPLNTPNYLFAQSCNMQDIICDKNITRLTDLAK